MLQITEWIKENAKVQEGDLPSEDPVELFNEFNRLADEFESLVERINRTNLNVLLSDGRTMTKALAHRDTLKFHINVWRQAAEAASIKQARSTKSEIKYVSVINVRESREKADGFSREYRELDAMIQSANWLKGIIGLI